MLEIIKEKLKEIEEREGVRILYCVESGSRAWGFASPDSDYDVRFIYVRPREYYLSLDNKRDVIEWQLDDTLDINGWDLQKALKLAHKSNPSLLEWLSSPIVYKTTEEWREIASVIKEHFECKSGAYHYLSIAKSNYREYLGEEVVKLKKYFYALRPILACRWILEEGTPPPVRFDALADKYLDDSIKPDVEKLLSMKRSMPELGEGERLDKINDYLARAIEDTEKRLSALPDSPALDWDALNGVFLKIIG